MTTAPGPGSRLAIWAAALLLLGVSVVVGCRITDTDAVTPVPQLLAFLPWLLLPALLGLLLALLARWWPGLVWGAALLLALGWFIEPYRGGAEATLVDDGQERAELRHADVHERSSWAGLSSLLDS